jgi:hypothetical protein
MLRELAPLLPAYTSSLAITDDCATLFEALQAHGPLGEKFSVTEWELLNDLIGAAERAGLSLTSLNVCG